MPSMKVVRINNALVYSIFFAIFRGVTERGKEKKQKLGSLIRRYNDDIRIIKLFEKTTD